MKKGCLITFLVLVAIVGIACIFVFDVPGRLGLVQSPAERLLDLTPDREAAANIMEDLEAAGLDTRGVQVYVFPVKEEEGSVALVVLNASQGFDFSGAEDDLVTSYLAELATGGAAEQCGVEQVAIDYRNESGESLFTFTAPAEAIAAYKAGTISQEQFLSQVDADINLIGLAGEAERLSQ